MPFVLMILRLVLGLLFPASRDGLSVAARPDGRVELVPHSAWDWLLGSPRSGGSRSGGNVPTGTGARGGAAPEVRAGARSKTALFRQRRA